jgi:hypothetical protein
MLKRHVAVEVEGSDCQGDAEATWRFAEDPVIGSVAKNCRVHDATLSSVPYCKGLRIDV